jgi:hypothetical protein
MSPRPAKITQADATRLFSAAHKAGYERARLVSHPDGRIEIMAETIRVADDRRQIDRNEWDDVL